jgi:hypothetical protein
MRNRRDAYHTVRGKMEFLLRAATALLLTGAAALVLICAEAWRGSLPDLEPSEASSPMRYLRAPPARSQREPQHHQ